MSTIDIIRVNDVKSYKKFAMFPFSLYKKEEPWVAPIISDYMKYIKGVNNNLGEAGPYELIIAEKEGQTLGRLIVGIDNELNKYHGLKVGYISEFECINDFEVAKKMLDYAFLFLKERGMTLVKGPLSIPGGDDKRGFIIDKFSESPSVLNTYNKKYYNDLFLEYGFEKYFDCYAYKATVEDMNIERYKKVFTYAMEKFDFHLDKINLKEGIKKDSQDIKEIIEKSMPKEWKDFMPLSQREIDLVVAQLKPYADRDLIFIARNGEGEPIGFNISLPDYNEILKRLRGRILPFGFLKFLYYKNKINRVRMFVLFVIPEYRKKGVTGAIYYKSFMEGVAKGYNTLEGSTIWEYNKEMIADIEKFGGKKDITYRIYQKEIV